MAKDIYDAIYGCLIGGAVGDSLGAPVEGWSYKDIRKEHGKVEEFMPFETGYSDGSPGTVTDDSVLRHYLCLAIIEKQGRITPDDYAKIWQEKLNPDRLWLSDRIAYQRIKGNVNPWTAGEGTLPAGCASMSIAPVGIINAGNPAQAYQDGFNIASVNQKGNNRDFAATVAAAVAKAFLPGVSIKEIIETMFEFSTELSRRALDLTMELAYESENVDQFTEKFYENMLDWTWWVHDWDKEEYHHGSLFSGNSLELVPVVPAILYLCEGDVNQSIIEGASFGRDCDTIASIAGNIAGIIQGAENIRNDWIDKCEEANGEFFAEVSGDPEKNFAYTAEKMTAALKAEKERKKENIEILENIIS